jgi:ribosome recycling factor
MADSSTIDGILKDTQERMGKSVAVFQREIETIRTGRATPQLLDNFGIDYYGTKTPLNQLATITAPDARLLTIQPWDRQSLSLIEKEILKSDLGLTPSNDGTIIRLPIPPLTEDRRRDLVKRLKRTLEEDHIAIRNVRRDSLEHLRKAQKDGDISEDELHRAQERLQKITADTIAHSGKLSETKEHELMEV